MQELINFNQAIRLNILNCIDSIANARTLYQVETLYTAFLLQILSSRKTTNCTLYQYLHDIINNYHICFPATQVFGRFLVLFIVLRPSEEIHEHPIVCVLFLVWSLIELFRFVSDTDMDC